MVQILVVEKGGNIEETEFNDFNFETLYKKCKFRKSEGFEVRATWKVGDNIVSIYARNKGKAGNENKYDLPPPIDNSLFFGSIAIVALDSKDNSIAVDLTRETWTKIYEKLFGGFFNLADTIEEDENEVDELDNVPNELKTKHGYLKDDFIVDDHMSSKSTSVSESPEVVSETDDYESELDFEEYEYMDTVNEESEEESDEEEMNE